jgi:hypothetical protein
MSFLKKIDKNTIFVGIAIVAIIIIVGLVFADSNQSLGTMNFFGPSTDEIAKKAIDYINDNGLSSTPASLVSASDESGLIKMKIKIAENEFDSYVSKDGKFLFPQAIEMIVSETDTGSEDNQNASGEGPTTVDEIQKTDNPMLDAYVVSRCPFGLQMQRMMAEAVKEAPELAQYIKARYMGEVSNGKITAMHGDDEAQENLRQICIREEQPTKYWSYVSCQMKAGDTTGCEGPSGVNSAELSACISTASRGLAYAQEDFDLEKQYSIPGSPTLILDGTQISEFNFGGRSAEAIKTIVCAASVSEPSFCATTLNGAEAASSFSETYEGSGSSGDVSCE